MLQDDLGLVVVLEDLVREVERGEVLQAGGRAAHFPHRHAQRLALFLGEQAGELFLAGEHGFGQLVEQVGALLQRALGPGRERGLGGGHGFIELFLAGGRAGRDHFFGRRVQHIQGRGAGHQSTVDEQFEVGHGISWDFDEFSALSRSRSGGGNPSPNKGACR